MKYLALTALILFFVALICAPAAADVIVIYTGDDAKPSPTPTKDINDFDLDRFMQKAEARLANSTPAPTSSPLPIMGLFAGLAAAAIITNRR